MEKVGIIGASGFIGSYITKLFLEKDFWVKASVTNLNNSEKYKHLTNFSNAENLRIQSLQLENLTSVKTFVKDCNILIHCGTPFQLETENPDLDLFEPTVKGTENVLKAICELPSIKKVVFVSSVASYNTSFPYPAGNQGENHIYSENDEPYFFAGDNPYALAKYHANKLVENFIESNKNLWFEVVNISPVAVMGKALSNRKDSTSIALQHFIKNKITQNPFIQSLFESDTSFAVVDVEDVAYGIYKAAITEGIHGKNYLLSSESWSISDISLLLNNKTPVNTPKIIYNNSLAKADLGINFKSAKAFLKNLNPEYNEV